MSQPAPRPAPASARPREHALLAWLEEAASRLPDKTFVHSIDQGRAISFAGMHDLAGRVGTALRARGIGANDRVALLSGNSLEHLIVYLGTMCHGATVCTVQVDMNRAHLGEILRALDPALTLHEDALGLDALAASAPGEWRALGRWDNGDGFFAELARTQGAPRTPLNAYGDVASIFYTSGTASKPKGVVCSFAELLENVEPTADAFGIGEGDRVLDFRSYNWMSAQVLSFLGPLARGATLYMARKFSQSRYFAWIRDFDITIAACNPTAINMLVNRPIAISGADLPHLRYITSSSAALMVADWKAFEEMYGIRIAQGCGTSETGWIAGSNERTRRMGSVGRPHAYQNLAIVDEAGNPLPAGEIGAIEMGRHPDNEFRYLAEDGSYRVNSRGRARTGDLGYLDAEGYLYITGRARDLIIRGGINIAPTEIDNLVLQMQGVAEAATVGVPDPIYGEEVVVYVVPKPGATLDEAAVLSHCGSALPLAKRPKRAIFLDALPKSERGKMDRQALLAQWRETQRAHA
ncbi:MAG: class I adenylate-forming enzyme family protein [Defluviicoccus sp.]|nr:class I adenylate-forming enzyme family protein [Defluviicoccus sp.]MDE0383101.1 class I adenylate-forming enzyme family protein [Defluviicoccus sp.]